MELSSRSECFRQAPVAPYWFDAPSMPLSCIRVLARLDSASRSSRNLPRREAYDRATILSSGSTLLQGMTHASRRLASRRRHLPWASCPYSACSVGSPLDPGCCRPRHVPASGLRTLLPVCSSRRLPGLFHPGSALGVPPFRGFPSQEAAPPRRCAPCPPGVCSRKYRHPWFAPDPSGPDPRV